MRIGILIPEFPGQTHIFFWREIAALRDLGLQVQILSTRRPSPDSCTHHFAAIDHGAQYCWPPPAMAVCRSLIRWPGGAAIAVQYVLRLKHSGSLARRIGLWLASLVLADSSRVAGVQFIYGHSCADSAHLLAMVRRICAIPYGLCLHGDLEAYGADHRPKFERAEFVLAASRRHLEAAERSGVLNGIPHEPLTMGVDLSRVIERQPLMDSPLRVVTVARLNRAKGHEVALQALRECSDRGIEFIYTIVGSGDYRAAIERKIHELGLGNKVIMSGALDADAVAQVLARHDVFVLPSVGIGEAAPVAVMEAMAAGLAIVCSRIGDTEDMVRDGVDGVLTEKGDASGIANAIERFASDRRFMERCGESARSRAIEQFDCRQQAMKLFRWITGNDSGEAK